MGRARGPRFDWAHDLQQKKGEPLVPLARLRFVPAGDAYIMLSMLGSPAQGIFETGSRIGGMPRRASGESVPRVLGDGQGGGRSRQAWPRPTHRWAARARTPAPGGPEGDVRRIAHVKSPSQGLDLIPWGPAVQPWVAEHMSRYRVPRSVSSGPAAAAGGIEGGSRYSGAGPDAGHVSGAGLCSDMPMVPDGHAFCRIAFSPCS